MTEPMSKGINWSAPKEPEYDEHGFKKLKLMTPEDKLDEILTHMRTTAITIKEFVESAEKNPMLKMFLPKK